jgi:hypothetical protein
MSKRQRISKNPVDKLIQNVSQLDNIVKSILENADKPDFVSSLVSLRQQKEEEDSKKSRLSSEGTEIVKILQTYPGLSKVALVFLKSKISEYKSLGVLDQYKSGAESGKLKKELKKKKTEESELVEENA